MKIKITALIICCLLVHTSHGQLLKRLQKKLEDKVEQKTDDLMKKAGNKTDQKIDDIIKKTEDEILGTNKKDKENSKEEADTEVLETSSNDHSDGKDLLKSAGKPRSQYRFSDYIKMKTIATDQKGKTTTTYRVEMGTHPNVMAISDLQMNNDSKKKPYSINKIVYDIDQKEMFTFMEANHKKSYIGLAYDAKALAREELNRSTAFRVKKITKTLQTKRIAGKVADAYHCVSNRGEAIIWISRSDGLVATHSFYNLLNSSSTGGKKEMPVFYNTKLIKQKLQAGAMVLSYEWEGLNNEKVVMVVEQYGSAAYTFQTTPYTNPQNN